jgi:hypothetical protein
MTPASAHIILPVDTTPPVTTSVVGSPPVTTSHHRCSVTLKAPNGISEFYVPSTILTTGFVQATGPITSDGVHQLKFFSIDHTQNVEGTKA